MEDKVSFMSRQKDRLTEVYACRQSEPRQLLSGVFSRVFEQKICKLATFF